MNFSKTALVSSPSSVRPLSHLHSFVCICAGGLHTTAFGNPYCLHAQVPVYPQKHRLEPVSRRARLKRGRNAFSAACRYGCIRELSQLASTPTSSSHAPHLPYTCTKSECALINVATRRLEDFYHPDTPRCAILSHTWGMMIQAVSHGHRCQVYRDMEKDCVCR